MQRFRKAAADEIKKSVKQEREKPEEREKLSRVHSNTFCFVYETGNNDALATTAAILALD